MVNHFFRFKIRIIGLSTLQWRMCMCRIAVLVDACSIIMNRIQRFGHRFRNFSVIRSMLVLEFICDLSAWCLLFWLLPHAVGKRKSGDRTSCEIKFEFSRLWANVFTINMYEMFNRIHMYECLTECLVKKIHSDLLHMFCDLPLHHCLHTFL